MNLAFANGILLILVFLEILFLSVHEKEKIPWREVIFNLNSGHILMWILRGLELGAFHLVYVYWSFELLDGLTYVQQWLFAFVVWDFCFYWLHRLHHQFELLWAVHVVHHEGEHFSLSLGIRNSWYSSVTAIPFFMGLAVIGVPPEIYLIVSSIHYSIQFYNHNRVIKNSGWLEKVMITPSHHEVHHGCNAEYLDKNFGGTFVIWDKIFGTFQPKIKDVPVICGTADYVKTYNVAWASNLPFLKIFNFPKIKNKKSYPDFQLSDTFIVFGGVLLFGLLLHYIFQENTWDNSMKLFFFNIIFWGTIGNGGLADGKYWGLAITEFNFLLLAPVFIFYYKITAPILLLNMGLLMWYSLGVIFNHKTYCLS
ncbi:MAG TPA: fatty acid hydroxylase family protein [Phaeodactylibacter sp.]|nr:fatty acid hydroxylase family protein [Phaeodactylibacter sp.]